MALERLPGCSLPFFRLIVAEQRLRQPHRRLGIVRRQLQRLTKRVDRHPRMVVDQGERAFHAKSLDGVAARRRQLIGQRLRLLVQYRRMPGIADVYSQTEIRKINFRRIVLWIQRYRAVELLICVAWRCPFSAMQVPAGNALHSIRESFLMALR